MQNTFKNIGVKYDNCQQAASIIVNDPATLIDRFPSYGTKSKYQVKSLISIVNMEKPV
jgi:hypothetical protein